MKMSTKKTKAMVFSEKYSVKTKIVVNDTVLEQANTYTAIPHKAKIQILNTFSRTYV